MIPQYLYSSDEYEEVRQVRVPDCWSRPRKAAITIQDIPAQRLIDTGADRYSNHGRRPLSEGGFSYLLVQAGFQAARQSTSHIQPDVPAQWLNGPQHNTQGNHHMHSRVPEDRCPGTAPISEGVCSHADWLRIILKWLLPMYRTRQQRVGP